MKTLKIYELYKPVFEIMAKDGLNISLVEDGLSDETVYIEIEDWRRLEIGRKGTYIYQGNKFYFFDRLLYSMLEV